MTLSRTSLSLVCVLMASISYSQTNTTYDSLKLSECRTLQSNCEACWEIIDDTVCPSESYKDPFLTNIGEFCLLRDCHRCPNGGFYLGDGQCLAPSYVASASLGESSCNLHGNPCDVITGRKVERQTDIIVGSISYARYYDSGTINPLPWTGAFWKHSFITTINRGLPVEVGDEQLPASYINKSGLQLFSSSYFTKHQACEQGWPEIRNKAYRGLLSEAQVVFNETTELCELYIDGQRVGLVSIIGGQVYRAPNTTLNAFKTISRPNGAFYTFEEISPNSYQEVSGYDVRLEKDGEDFLFYDTNGTIDRFVDNKMVQRTLPNKKIINLTYSDNGWLDTVSDEFGQTLEFDYDENGQISSVTYPDGQIQYGYDANFNLISVTYEGDSTRQYHYEDTRHPHHLTGITDERGIRYATWTYDEEGKATSSSHAGDADRTTFTYTDNSTIVTDPTGATREYHIGMENKQLVVTHVTGDPCRDCWKGDAAEREYDANGHLSRVTDWKGNVTTYVHNGRGQEISRTEAFGTPQARTITTEWHPEFNQPTRITEPERETQITYDSNGRVLSRDVRPRSQQP